MDKTDVPFDQFQRYETIARLIEYHRKGEACKYKVLELGANEHKDLALFLPNDEILFTDISLTNAMRNDPDFIEANGTALPFEDGSFDFVVAADVFEHVKKYERERFISESYRVAKKAVILSFPFNSRDIVDAEKRVNSFYKALAGEDFIWLKEHRDNTLPDIADVNAILDKRSSQYFQLFHGDILVWEKMWYCTFDALYSAKSQDFHRDLDEFYNKNVYSGDVSDSCYRTFYVISHEDTEDWKKYSTNLWARNESFEEASRFLDTLISSQRDLHVLCEKNQLNETILDKERHITNQNHIIEDKERHIQNQNEIISDKERHIQSQNQIIEDKERHIQNQNQIIENNERLVQDQKQVIENEERIIQDQKKIIEDKERVIQNQSSQIEDDNRALQAKKVIIEIREREIENQNSIIEAQKQAISQRDKTIEENRLSAESAAAEAQRLKTENIEIQETYRLEAEKIAADYSNQLTLIGEEKAKTDAELNHYKTHYFAAINQREELKVQLAAANNNYMVLSNAYNTISNAAFWKMTAPFRKILDWVKRILWKNRFTRLFCKGIKCWRENGLKYTWNKVKDKLRHRQNFLALACRPLYTQEELDEQRKHEFPRKIKISIVVPLYNTPKNFLEEMIRSVLDQTYSDWELCMADGSDGKHAYVKSICKQYARADKRVVYKKLSENKGISENTNACIEMATGEYIGLLDHDDLLHPAALYNVMEAICEKDADFIYTDENTFREKPEDAYCPAFKPDYAPDTLRSYNYICHFTVFDRRLLEQIGQAFRSRFDGSQDYDIILRLTEKARHIEHIPKILYYWRASAASVASDVSAKPYTLNAAKLALQEHLERVGLKGQVKDARIPSTYKIDYEIEGEPLISIIIPNKDHVDDLKKCLDSIREKSTYQNWEIIIVENNSTEKETFQYYESLHGDSRIHVVYWDGPFNYSAINNFGIQFAHGEHILLLNNDIKVISPDWLEQMLMYSQRVDVGAVGAMLYYPDDTIQHAGVILGIGGVGGHSHKYFKRGDYGYMSRLAIVQNLTAVTAACVMIPRRVWDEVKGLDEGYKVAFNDVDLCMRIREAGYLIVWTPYAELYHYESKSRGLEDTPEKQTRFSGEVKRFLNRWDKELAAGDPYYNPNLTLEREDFSLR